jgi:hypothetical protein
LQTERNRGASPIPIILIGAIALLMIANNPSTTPSNVLTINTEDESNIPGVQEVHWATSKQGCEEMLQRFRAEGRNLSLKVRYTRPMPGSRRQLLHVVCLFEGPDARDDYYINPYRRE